MLKNCCRKYQPAPMAVRSGWTLLTPFGAVNDADVWRRSSPGPQLMAEIGDVRRFHSKKALVAFTGIDAPPYQSGTVDIRSLSISKRGSATCAERFFL